MSSEYFMFKKHPDQMVAAPALAKWGGGLFLRYVMLPHIRFVDHSISFSASAAVSEGETSHSPARYNYLHWSG